MRRSEDESIWIDEKRLARAQVALAAAGRGPFDNLASFSRETSLNRNLIGCQQIGLKRM